MKWEQTTSTPKPSIAPKSADVVINKFDDETIKILGEAIAKAAQNQQPYLPIYISSYGGSAYHLLNAISMVKAAPMEIHTIVMGHAMSAGALLFCFGERRFLAPDAYLMFHDVAAGQSGKIDTIETGLKHIKLMRDRILKLASKNIGKRVGYFRKKLLERSNDDWYLDAKEALSEGIATELDIPRYLTRTKTEYACVTSTTDGS